MKLTDLLHEAGVPQEVVQVVTGRGSDVGDVLAGHPAVSYTHLDVYKRQVL